MNQHVLIHSELENISKSAANLQRGKLDDNLRYLLSMPGMPEKMMLRLPLIPDFNTPEQVAQSRTRLQALGALRFDEFTYIVR